MKLVFFTIKSLKLTLLLVYDLKYLVVKIFIINVKYQFNFFLNAFTITMQLDISARLTPQVTENHPHHHMKKYYCY